MPRLGIRLCVSILASMCVQTACSAAEMFSRSTDTISIAGNPVFSNAATLEALVEFNSTTYINSVNGGSGRIFNATSFAQEDDALSIVNGGTLFGAAYPVNFPNGLYGGSLQTGIWYDITYVYNNTDQMLYINGNMVAQTAYTGPIGNGTSATTAIGAIFRDGSINAGFIGEIQSLRISSTARYSGSSYTPTYGDFTSDASTEMLYNFDNAPVGNTITDQSGNGNTGTLGTGFTGATSPTFVNFPEPATVGLLAVAAATCLVRRRNPPRSVLHSFCRLH